MAALELKQVSVSVEGKVLVHDTSFAVNAGDAVVLMGPNGSGKSSLVNAVMGHPHYVITAGQVLLSGVDITSLPTHERARHGLFLALQHTPSVGGVTLATFLHKVYIARTGEELDVLQYYLRLREMAGELGIDDGLLNRPLSQGLSGGQKKLSEVLQLAALAPRFAILDEIDSGVDVDALKQVFMAVERLRAKGTGFVIISHHPSLLDHLAPAAVHVMANGTVTRSGGKELAVQVHREGFCKVIECPLEPDCAAAH